jgi:hypothetical protein
MGSILLPPFQNIRISACFPKCICTFWNGNRESNIFTEDICQILTDIFFCSCRCRKDQEIAFVASHSLHNLLNASLLSESGPPLLDFEVK